MLTNDQYDNIANTLYQNLQGTDSGTVFGIVHNEHQIYRVSGKDLPNVRNLAAVAYTDFQSELSRPTILVRLQDPNNQCQQNSWYVYTPTQHPQKTKAMRVEDLPANSLGINW